MSNNDRPAPAYTDVEQENDPGQGTAIAEEAPAERGTLSTAADEREPGAGPSPTGGGADDVPGSRSGDTGFPSGSTDIPPSDTGGRRDGTAAESPLDAEGSNRAGSDPGEWPAADTVGVSGRAPGPADLDNPGGTGLTTADTEGGDR
ncbi:hypothetical protein [Cryptosporangium minutisporangium]|uniref:Uncharacterized protein n=1 Tax=Cryptosporangium minutisporangium TaxID=113569 RepID=A0ABP6TBU2_9ACTN